MNILNIPFLELDIDIDVNKLKSEMKIIEKKYKMVDPITKEKYIVVDPITNWYKRYLVKDEKNSFILPLLYKVSYWLARKIMGGSWSGISLYSTNGTLYKDLVISGSENIQPTELKDIAPYMFSVLDRIFGSSPKFKVRLLKMAPKSSLSWHSHVLEHNISSNNLVLQLPIILPKGFKYCVIHKDEWKWWKRFHKPSWFKTLKEREFEEGKLFYFNSYHYHNVYNSANEYRTTIVINVDARYNDIRKLFKKSLKNKNNKNNINETYK